MAASIKSVGIGAYVFCPMSNQAHPLFAIEVREKPSTGNLWAKCICGTRMHFDSGERAVMTKDQAAKSGATFPFAI